MKIVHIVSFYEYKDAGVDPYRTKDDYWEYCLMNDKEMFAFSTNKTEPTAFLECTHEGCHDGWHTAECIKSFRNRMKLN